MRHDRSSASQSARPSSGWWTRLAGDWSGRRTRRPLTRRGPVRLEQLEPRQLLTGDVVISEFLASNDTGIKDQDNDRSDWIELHNTTAAAVNLGGWFLTDDAANLNKWQFPSVSLNADAYLIVFASNKDRAVAGQELHANFKLSAAGEYLALVQPDGLTISHEFTPAYPVQSSDVSYGLSLGVAGYFLAPTPGAANGALSAGIGPVLSGEAHSPQQPTTGDDLVVSIAAAQLLHPIAGVQLHYRVMFGTEVVVNMVDDGTGGDAVAADGRFTAKIPQAAYNAGQMVRWYFTATDTSSFGSRLPTFLDATDAPEYFGTVVFDPTVVSNLNVLYTFAQNTTAMDAGSPTRIAIYYRGQFYDNVYIDIHGQSTQGFTKKSYNVDFNTGYRFAYSDTAPPARDINLLTNYADKAKVRNTLAYETFAAAGTPGHVAFPVRVQRNGQFFSVADFVEDGDDVFLDRLGLDPDGALYKMYNTLNSSTSGVEKKTRQYENNNDLQALVAATVLPDASRTKWIFDNVNLPELANFLASISIADTTDFGHKNYYLYRDTNGTGQWQMFPWDVDLTFGHNWTGSFGYFDDNIYTNNSLFQGAPAGNQLVIPLYNIPAFRQMYLRRVRAMIDQLLQPPGTPAADLKFEQRLAELQAQIGNDGALDTQKWGTWGQGEDMIGGINRILNQYLPARRTFIYNNQTVGHGGEIPDPQPDFAALPLAQRKITIGAVDYLPASGNQREEYVQILNANSFAVDISGWKLTDAVDYTFVPGTVIPANSAVYVTADMSAFRARTTGPAGNQGLFIVGNYRGQLSAFGETVVLTDAAGATIASRSYAGTPSLPQQFLRVTEIMYDPAPGGSFAADDYEFIELQNIGPNPLNVAGVKLTSGVDFAFPNTTIPGGSRVVLARNAAAFAQRYGGSITPLGAFTGALDNSGEKLRLADAVDEEILEFRYEPTWYPLTAGGGYSLVINDAAAAVDTWGEMASWRPSLENGGNPGSADNGIVPGSIRLNEILTNTVGSNGGWIELANTTAGPIDVGYWYLSDSNLDLAKFRIPAGTVVPGGGYLVLTAADDYDNPAHPGTLTRFRLSPTGGDVFLTSSDASGQLRGYREDQDYDAAALEVSHGRYIKSTGKMDFTALSAPTMGAANAYPLVGPVVINEVMYHPDVGGDEFVELWNISGAPVPLFDPARPANTWQFTAGMTFAFPTGVTLPAGGYAVVAAIDPAAFRAKYNVPAAVPVFGPFVGSLDNAGERVAVSLPGDPAGGPTVPYIEVDAVKYDDAIPWPQLPAGAGSSLVRAVAANYGNDVANWLTGKFGGTPGRANEILDVTPPTPPGNLTATIASPTRIDLSWSASSDAETGVAYYRVFRNGNPLTTTSATSFADLTVRPGGPYEYLVTAVNAHTFESAPSNAASATIFGIVEARDTAATKIVVQFSEPVTVGSAQNLANYTISGGVTLILATLSADGLTLTLTTSALQSGTTYRLAAQNLVAVSARPATLPLQTFFTAGAGTGLSGEYFDNADLTAPVLTRIDAAVNFNWTNAAPAPAMGASTFSVRWTGQLKATASETYTFYTNSDDGVRLWIDGALVVDNWNAHTTTENSGTAALIAGRKYDVVLEYFQNTGNSTIQLSWSSPSTVKQIIPQAQLFPPPTMAALDAAVPEGNAGTSVQWVTVRLQAPSSQMRSFAYATADGTATAGVDYTAASGTLTFGPGVSCVVVPLTILGDVAIEPSESFYLNLTPLVGSATDAQAEVTIVNDDLPTVSIGDVTIAEGDAGALDAVFTVTLSAAADAVTLAYATADGTATAGQDYTATSGTLTIAAGTLQATVSVPVLGDLVDETNETFVVDLSNVVGATLADAQGQATIVDDDDPATISIADTSVVERDSGLLNAQFSVTLSKASAVQVTVKYATANGTAQTAAPADYFARTGTLTFAPGVTQQSIVVPTQGDTRDEDDETFFVNLSNPVNASIARAQGICTIVDNDPSPDLSIGDVVVTEGNAGTVDAVFTLNLSAVGTRAATVVYQTADGTATAGVDYDPTSGTVTFAIGETTKTIAVAVRGDLVHEANETFLLQITSAVGANVVDSSGVATITDDDVAADFTVTNTLDSGAGSLRQALLDVLATPGAAHTITFNIPGAGPHVIAPGSALPNLTEATAITIGASQTIDVGGATAFGFPQFAGIVKTGAGTLVLGGNGPLAAGGSLTIADGVVQLGGGKLLALDALAAAGAGALDLASGDLVLHATAATRGAVLAQVTALIASGAAGLHWNGPGIRSSAAAADPALLTAVGAMLNDNGQGGPFHPTFDNQAVGVNDVLVKYTYYGDADLSGVVDGTDFALADNGFNALLTGWFNGDFDYSTLVDGTDYALIDNAFNAQGAPLAAAGDGGAIGPAAPRPRSASPSGSTAATQAALAAWPDDALAALAATDIVESAARKARR